MSTIIEDVNLHHCKTQLIKKPLLYYTWSIQDFLTICKSCEKLTSTTNNSKFYMNISQNNTLSFYVETTNSRFSTCLYSIFLNNSINDKICQKQDAKYSCSNSYGHLSEMNYEHSIPLYDTSISFFIENPNYLPNNTLTIHFEFYTFAVTNSSININHLFKPFTQTDADSFVPTEILNTIVTLIIDKEQTFQVNKLLLCSKSKVFKAMFDCGLRESQTNEVHISDMKHNILKELLYFLQTDYLSKKLEEMDVNVIHELFIAANKYEVEDLKLKCELYLITNITTRNVVEHLKIAYLHNGKILEKYTKNFIKLYLEDIMNAPNFISLMQEYPELFDQITNIQLTQMPAVKIKPTYMPSLYPLDPKWM